MELDGGVKPPLRPYKGCVLSLTLIQRMASRAGFEPAFKDRQSLVLTPRRTTQWHVELDSNQQTSD